MTTFVLNEQTDQTTVRELLASAVDQEIQISDESGRLVARLFLEGGRLQDDHARAVAWAEANIEDIRQVRRSEQGEGITINELMARVRALKQARCQASDESLAEAESMIDELRRSVNGDRSRDITTAELLTRLQALPAE